MRLHAKPVGGDLRALGDSIWTWESPHSAREAALSIARVLLDQPRWLEPCYLYDERGSQLFEEICELPEYYLTRTEAVILDQDAHRVISLAPVECIVELGAGYSRKTCYLLREQVRQHGRGVYVPVDVSLNALAASRALVEREFPELSFQGLLGRYEGGIAHIKREIPTLFVFLGSSVGNFTRSDFGRFFQALSDSMGPDDFFLLGVDRVKSPELLEKAYADSQGVTAEFILNAFNNINRLTGSNFDAGKMAYHSGYDRLWQQVEMYAVSTITQEIHFRAVDTSFVWEEGERILVEISRKFDPCALARQVELYGLKLIQHFTDTQQWFSLLLFRKANE